MNREVKQMVLQEHAHKVCTISATHKGVHYMYLQVEKMMRALFVVFHCHRSRKFVAKNARHMCTEIMGVMQGVCTHTVSVRA